MDLPVTGAPVENAELELGGPRVGIHHAGTFPAVPGLKRWGSD